MQIGYLHSSQAEYLNNEVAPLKQLKQGLKFDIHSLFLAFMKNDGRDKNTETALTRARTDLVILMQVKHTCRQFSNLLFRGHQIIAFLYVYVPSAFSNYFCPFTNCSSKLMPIDSSSADFCSKPAVRASQTLVWFSSFFCFPFVSRELRRWGHDQSFHKYDLCFLAWDL